MGEYEKHSLKCEVIFERALKERMLRKLQRLMAKK